MDAVGIRVKDGHKAYQRNGRRLPVFESVDLEVGAGEIIALLGPTGCGKSTLLRIIAGLEPLDRGEVRLGDSPRSTPAGIAFQQPSLLPWLTVAQNVELGLRFGANADAHGDDRVPRVLHDLGLSELADAYPVELSGGQAQRVNVARAAVLQRPVLLLDEPFGALDPRTRGALQDWLRQLRVTRGLTVVLVTHDVDEALRVADRVALLSGTPSTVTHVWDVRHVSGRNSRAASALRRQILARYTPENSAREALAAPLISPIGPQRRTTDA